MELYFRFGSYGEIPSEAPPRDFNGFGQLVTEWQEHSGSVTGSSLKVGYGYTEGSGGNHSRPTTLTYPDGRVLSYGYGTGVDAAITRRASMSEGSETLESYAYLGLGTIVHRTRGNDIGLTSTNAIAGGTGDAGDPYVGLDRFGRVFEQTWYDDDSSSVKDRFRYGYDRDGNRTRRLSLTIDPS